MKTTQTSGEYKDIEAGTLAGERGDWLLLDVRTPGEFATAHVEGSVSHPLQELDATAVRQLMENRKGCAVLCQSGNRARQAAARLAAEGLGPIVVLSGGVQAWDSAGHPLVRGKGVISLERQVRIAAGAIVVTGALLATFVNPAWIALSGFVGAGLVFAGITDTCGMGMLLARMPWNQRKSKPSCCA